ncbi:hypothetical protein [Burkholderia stagnalis]|uniref:hypothetical protein n=1 Tax=Burkholderia stagnalis TaxID=1503054 RepID=UPI000ADF356F|nr:hypothetical protein [Burkholderia stagnalis]
MTWGTLLQSLVVAIATACVTSYLIERRESAKSARNLNYLVLQIAFQLENFAIECADFIGDGNNYESSDGALGKRLDKLPDLASYPLDGEYALLDTQSLSRVLSFRLEVESSNSSISFEYELTGEHSAHDKCRSECVRLGLKAIKLSEALRARYKIPPFELEKDLWNYVDYLREQHTPTTKSECDDSPVS